MYDIILDEKFNIKKVTKDGVTYILKGKCLRCGNCCSYIGRCPSSEVSYLYKEVVDGKELYGCKIQSNKPFPCKLYPFDPDQKLEGCGYNWEKL